MHKSLMFRSRIAPLLLGVGLVGVLLFLGMSFQAHAAISKSTSDTLVSTFQATIKASSSPTAVIGLNLAGNGGELFASTSINITAASGFSTSTDLAPFTVATTSGIAIYRDNKFGGTPGTFDAADMVIPLVGAPTTVGATTTLVFAVPEAIPAADNTASTTGDDYFVVIQSALGATNGHAATFSLYPGEIGYAAGVTSSTLPLALTTGTLTVDTVAPSLVSSGPPNGATGVPISTFISAVLSSGGDMDFSTMNSSTITLATATTTVGVSINANPSGFNLNVSNPPTYAPLSRFSKIANTLFGFFMVNSGQPLFPQGPPSTIYSAPAAGDIIYFQHETFPPELGIVTNAALTGGTFAVNDFALQGGQAISRFSVASSTGAVSGTTPLGPGDLVVANTSASPAGTRYAWHIVTTSAPVNDAALRLDGAAAQPTYVGAKFSKIVPNATTTISSSFLVTATTTFSAGDLVFAKVVVGANNVNTYAWHIVTTGEAVTGAPPIGATGTTSALRLDDAAIAPTFAASSLVAVLSTGGQGLVTDTATTISNGDIVFANTTANSGINGGYAFHVVSSGNNGSGGAASANLRFDNTSSNLLVGIPYTLTIGTGVADRAGNHLASPAVVTFTTGSTGGMNITPPFAQSSTPQPGNQQFSNTAALSVTFSVDMATSGSGSVTNTANVGLYTDNFGTPGNLVSTTNTYNSSTRTVSLAHAALGLNTGYILVVKTTTQSSTNTSIMQEYRAPFRTATALDTTAPTVLGLYPATSTPSVSRNVILGAGFSEDIDPTTVSTDTVTLSTTAGVAVAGSVSYNPQSRSATFAPTAQLASVTDYRFVVGGASGIRDLAGNALVNATSTFTTNNVTDNVKPTIAFSNADNFSIAVTFSEPVKSNGGPNAADNIANYTLESPTGSSISLGGKTVTYDSASKTAKITGLSLQNANSFKVTVSSLAQDLAGNGMDTTGTPAKNTAFGTVANATQTGGMLGPGSGPMNDPGMQGMNPTAVIPMTRAAGATSDYQVKFLAGTSIPLGSKIVLTFPSGFDVTNATTSNAGSQSFCNSDINGPMTGVVQMDPVSVDVGAGSITLTTNGAATGANAFLCIDLKNIVNSTVPSASGYTVDIKTKDAGNNLALLESKTSAPFFLGQTGSDTVHVQVFHDDSVVNQTKDSGEGIASVSVFLFSPATGGQSTTTDAAGDATFNNLADGVYQIGLQPSTAGSYAFNSAPQQLSVTTASSTKQFIIAAALRTIAGTVYGPAATKLDVFAASPNGFTKTTVTTDSTPVAYSGTTYAGSAAYSLPAQNNTTYQVGVGPSMPDSFMIPGAPPPPPPTFNFMPPQPLTVGVTTFNVTGRNFTLATASNTIVGSVKDSSGAAVSNAGVFCRPVQTDSTGGAIGNGTGGQTGTNGSFTLNTVPGVYLCGVFKPGMPMTPDKQVTIAASGAQTPNPLAFTLGASGSSLTITGTIKDDGGNAVPYAGVSARKVTSTTDTTPVGGGASNFVGGPADSNGAYTLYVTSGTWVVEAFAPGVGRLGTKTVTVSGSSLTGQDFSAQTLNLGSITGTSTQATVGVQGVMVRADNADGTSGNMTTTGADGKYTLKVPAGTYTVRCFFPGIGEATPLTSIAVTASTATNDHNCSISAPITVTVRVTDGTNPIQNAFVDVRDSNGRGNGTNVSTTSGQYGVYVVTVPPGTYSVRIGHPAYGPIGAAQTVAADANLTATSTGSSLAAVTGTVTGNGSALSGAWVSLTGTPTGQSNLINMGGQTGTSGTFSISVPNGTYKIRANKPGYKSPAETTVTVSGATAAGTIALTTAGRTISGTVTLSGNGVAGAFVDANNGVGGYAVAQTDTSGAYSLAVDNGTWVINARSQGYEASVSGITTANNSVSGVTLALTAISGFSVKPERQENVTPTAGGNLVNVDIGSNFKLNIPANALGTSANAGTVTTKANTAVPTPANGTVLAKNAVTISASDSSGQPIKTLNDKVTVVVPYTAADLPAGTSESNLVLGVWNDATQAYDTLSTTVDTVNKTLTAVVSHLSDFAPLVTSNTSNGTVVVTTSSVGTSSGGGGGGSGSPVTSTYIPLAQATPVVPATGKLEPAATPQVTTPSAVTSSTAAAPTPIAISPYTRTITIGVSGDDVTALQTFLEGKGFLTMPKGIAKGFFGQATKKALTAYQKSVGLPPVGLFGPQTKSKVEGELSITVSVPVATFTYDRNLGFGSSGGDVSTLQTFLEGKGFLTMPKGMAKGYFGQLTAKALAAYQKSVGISAVGAVGPQTRTHLNGLPK